MPLDILHNRLPHYLTKRSRITNKKERPQTYNIIITAINQTPKTKRKTITQILKNPIIHHLTTTTNTKIAIKTSQQKIKDLSTIKVAKKGLIEDKVAIKIISS